jgi:phenylacetate-coenzyme A ligase PaaK-like adenylate-forming protein
MSEGLKIKIDDIKEVEDIIKLPFITKKDIIENFPIFSVIKGPL